MEKAKPALKLAVFIIVFCFLEGCFEKNTSDPIEVYKYWMGENPSNEIQLINGTYWESAHFTKEYILYLEIRASDLWRSEFMKENNLKTDTAFVIPDDAPIWFKPQKNMRIWKPSGFDQGSIFFEDTVAGRLLIYSIQL